MHLISYLLIFFSFFPSLYIQVGNYFVRRVDRLCASKDREKGIRLAELLVQFPTLPRQSQQKLSLQFVIASSYIVAKRYEECILKCKAALAEKPEPERELRFRQLLVDAFTEAGYHQDAMEERQHALLTFKGKPITFATFNALGTLLLQEKRYQEAYTVYEQALPVVPTTNRNEHDIILLHLADLAATLDRPALAVKWAEAVISRDARIDLLITAYKIAGDTYAKIGELATAERLLQKRYDMTVQNNPEVAAIILQKLGAVFFRMGKIDAALNASTQAMDLSPKIRRTAYRSRATYLNTQGRFEEGRRELQQALDISVPAPPDIVGHIHHNLSRTLSECQEWDAASSHLEQARAMFASDTKMLRRCDELEAANLVRQGRISDALSKLPNIEAQLSPSDDQNSRFHTLFVIAYVYYHAGQYQLSVDYCLQCLDKPFDPVYQPKVLYYLGECHWHLGNKEAARDAWQQAVALNIDIVEARKAQDRLREYHTLPHDARKLKEIE